jgi:acetylornithine/N-succinyldiaminopimelate aminotransferase
VTAPILPVYSPPEEVFVRGEGLRLWTDDGTEYLDFIAGIAVNCLGHAHPKLVAALTEQAGKLWHLSNMFRGENQEKLAQAYVDATFADYVFFTNSGTEAVEGVLKAMRKFHSAGGAPERVDVITFSGSFHGRSYGGINAAGNPAYLRSQAAGLRQHPVCRS